MQKFIITLITALFFASFNLSAKEDLGAAILSAKMQKREHNATGFFERAKDFVLTLTMDKNTKKDNNLILEFKRPCMLCPCPSINTCFTKFRINLKIKDRIEEGCGVIKYIAEYWSGEIGDENHIQNASIHLIDYRNDYCFHQIKHSWLVPSLESDLGTNYHSTVELYGNPEKLMVTK